MSEENLKIAIISIRAGAEWELTGDAYDDLVWKDEKQSKPTKEEVDSMIEYLISINRISR